jgi:hypothetical protein
LNSMNREGVTSRSDLTIDFSFSPDTNVSST